MLVCVHVSVDFGSLAIQRALLNGSSRTRASSPCTLHRWMVVWAEVVRREGPRVADCRSSQYKILLHPRG